jgi:predicted Zn-dependent protease
MRVTPRRLCGHKWASCYLLALGLCGLLEVASTPPAAACLNAVEMSRKQASQIISSAEKSLADGNATDALHRLSRFFGDKARGHVTSASLQQKLEQLYAIACFRAGNQKAIEQAIKVLREQSKNDPKSPLLKVRLAEALSHSASDSKEALSLLETLDKADLIVDAEGYAALARLRKQTGNEAGAQAALTRCRTITKREPLCSDAPLPPPSELACPQGMFRDLDLDLL